MVLKLLKWLLYGAAGIVALVGLALVGVLVFFPRSEPAPDLTLEATPQRLERGEYLVRHVAFCLDCHSERDWSIYGAPVVAGTEGRGAQLAIFRLTDYSANITPAAIGDWTDGEVVRAITAGVKRDGEALHPYMPFDTYAGFAEEDVFAIVAYLRTLPPIEHVPPPHELPLPMRLIGRMLPTPWTPEPAPERTDTVAYGRYLAGVAECGFCHGGDYAGGRSFALPGGGTSISSDLRPLPSGLGERTRANFVGMFRAFGGEQSRSVRVPEGEKNTVMPWLQYAGMTDQDLGAIYDYLRALPVEEPPPSP